MVSTEFLTRGGDLGTPSTVWGCLRLDRAASAVMSEFAAEPVSGDAALGEKLVAAASEVLAQLVAQKALTAAPLPLSTDGKAAAAGLVVKVDSGFIADAVAVSSGLACTQSVFDRSTVAQSKATARRPNIIVCPNSTPPIPPRDPKLVSRLR